VSFTAITLCVASQRVFIVVSIYFVTESVRKLLDTPPYNSETNYFESLNDVFYTSRLLFPYFIFCVMIRGYHCHVTTDKVVSRTDKTDRGGRVPAEKRKPRAGREGHCGQYLSGTATYSNMAVHFK
jgi:hypothetical protein